MKGLKRILLLITLSIASHALYAQSTISGTVRDVDTQMIISQFVEVYSDTPGIYYPYHDTTHTDAYGNYSFTLPVNLPSGVIIRVRTNSCNTPVINTFLYPFTTIACDFVICATNKYIKGNVYRNGNYADMATTFLIQRHFDSANNTHILQKIDSMEVNGQGAYNFKLPLSGSDSYMVKAALLPADTANYLHFLPSYYTNSALQWSSAAIIPKQNTVADILLANDYPMQGQAYLSGTVLEGANKSSSVGDSLYKRILILTTANDVPVAYTYSNTNGNFGFGGLDYGVYKLFGDALGKYNPPLYISLSPGSASLIDIVFEENSTSFVGSLWPLSVKSTGNPDLLNVYPNPATDFLQVNGLENIAGEKNISLYSITGALAYNVSVQGNDAISIPVGNLTKGLYVLSVRTTQGNYLYKIVR